MSKEIYFRTEALKKMVVGLDKAADAIGGTIGPQGRNVYLDDLNFPKIINDGARIADKMQLEDKLENAGAYVIRNVSAQQHDDSGDGTTTVTVLTQAIIHECLKRPENAMEIKNSLKEASEKILKLLAKKSIPVKKEDVEKIALISSEDKHIAKLITEIVNKLGKEAVINVEDSKTFETDYEITDGYDAHVGFMSPLFINDKSGRAIYSDIPVLVSETKISNLAEIAPIFEMFKKEGVNNCVIVCEDIDDAMLGILVNSKRMGTFNSIVIRANGWLLQDIERATGAMGVSKSNGVSFSNFTKENLGFAKKVISTMHNTLFITDGVSAKKFAKVLEAQLENEPNQIQARTLKQRIAKLKGGLAVLRIGASTDFERDYLREKADDSVKAVQAALAEGYVEGGGMTLWRLAQELKGNTIGEQILKKAMTAPLRKIIENCGKDYTEVLLEMNKRTAPDLFVSKVKKIDIKEMKPGKIFNTAEVEFQKGVRRISGQIGYNAKTDKYENLIESGIIDPTKVERTALENAISAASIFITTSALVCDLPEEKK